MLQPKRNSTRIKKVYRIRLRSSSIFHALRNVSNTLDHLGLPACLFDLFLGRGSVGGHLDGQGLGEFTITHSTGYGVTLPDCPTATSLEFSLSGSDGALYYIEINDRSGKNRYASGWKLSPVSEKRIRIDFPPHALKEIRIYTQNRRPGKVFNLFRDLLLSTDKGIRPLALNLSKSREEAKLDIRRAVAHFRNGKEGESEIRVLKDRNVVLVKTPADICLEPIKASTLPPPRLGESEGMRWMLMEMPGDRDYRGMTYAVVLGKRGPLKAISLVSSFDIGSDKVLEPALDLVRRTLKEREEQLVARHEREWESTWSRSGIEIDDPAIQRWWYRVLYFARTVCKPGAAPVALMPPLATDDTPWHADYHHNYNSWQAFYPLPGCNLPELADPWISYIHDLLPSLRFLARETFGLDGIFMPISSFLHMTDPALCTSRNGRLLSFYPWGLTIGMVGMTLQSIWQKELYQPDPAYLKAKIYPILREGAKFYLGFIRQCRKREDGKILLGPSYSPEHGQFGIYDCPYDLAYVRYTLHAFIQAAEELGVDGKMVSESRRAGTLLPDYPTRMHKGKRIVVDWRDGPHIPEHNITVPVTPVFPGEQVTWFSPEPVKDLFRDTIRATRFNGNNAHVMFNIAKARLSMPEGVIDSKRWFLSRELPNGLFRWKGHLHGTYMGEMIGIAGLINEFLIQSVKGKIRLFPCWPKDRDARFSKLRCEGGFLVSAEQRQGRVVHLEILSTAGGRLTLLSPWKNPKLNGRALKPDSRNLIEVETEAGERLLFTE